MSTTLSAFVDHYILLLAARYHAPLTAEELLADSNNNNNNSKKDNNAKGLKKKHDADSSSNNGGEEAWRWVSEALQQSLSCPRTLEEKRQLLHIDPASFTPSVCRERAMFLCWRQKQDSDRRSEKRREARRAANANSNTINNNTSDNAAAQGKSLAPADGAAGAVASSFDVTCNSLTADIESLFAAVRRSLPSALLGDSSSSDDEEDNSNSAASGGGMLAPGVIVDVHMSSAEEARRAHTVAVARDNFLTKVQALQAEFYATHHRWVDVPSTLLDAPGAPASAPADTIARRLSGNTMKNGSSSSLSAPHMSVAAERAELLAALSEDDGSAAAAIAALRRSVHVSRPARPSACRGDSHANGTAAAAAVNGSTETQKQLPSSIINVAPTSAESPSAASAAPPPPPAPPAAPARRPAAAPMRETAPPAGRRNRWQIVEYEEDADDE